MSGITTGVGVFSGINSGQLIDQLIALESRPKQTIQARVGQIQLQQAAYLDINSRITALKSAAAGFRLNNTFQTKTATSSAPDVLSASAGISAAPGNYTFVVDRLTSTQHSLTRGFANKDTSGVGATTISFESSAARLDRDVELADLNAGSGVHRGKMVVTDSLGHAATIDLSRATHVSEVLDAINSNPTALVSASVQNGKFIIKDNAGGTVTVANTEGSSVATDLGIAGVVSSGGVLTGSNVYHLSGATTLASLNDGNGVAAKQSTTEDSFNFTINVGGATPHAVRINIGDVYSTVAGKVTKTQGAVSDVNGVIKRINDALTAAGVTDVTAAVDSTNNRLTITDASGTKPVTVTEGTDTTAADLGLLTTPVSGNIVGRRVLAGMQTTLLRGLSGGAVASNDGVLKFHLKDGSDFTASLNTAGSVQDALDQIETASKVSGVKRVSATLDAKGTGFVISDLTSGSSAFAITGNSGSDAAVALGISTGDAGTTASSVSSGNRQRKYMSRATLLSSLNGGRGVGNGDFRITDSSGASAAVKLTDSVKSVGDLLDFINSRGLKITAAINTNGDGVSITEKLSPGETAGSQKIKVEESGGSVARNLNLLGTASGTGASNVVDGSCERTVTLLSSDTLQQISDKINAAKAGVSASIVRDGGGSAPYRLSLTSTNSGTAGRFIVDSGSFDLGLASLDAGRDSRVFFGSSDPAQGIAVTSSTNTLDTVVPGVSIDLKSASSTPVNLTIESDTDGIQSSIQTFIQTFNTAIDRIENQTKYDKDADKKAPLLGDSTMLELHSKLFATISEPAKGATGTYTSLAQVGISVGAAGNLTLDSTKLQAALAADPASVEALFTAKVSVDDSVTVLGPGISVRNVNAGNSYSTLGVIAKIENLATTYTDGAASIFASRSSELTSEVQQQTDRISALDDRLAQRRLALQNQFAAMEAAIGKLQSQQSALGSLGQTG